MVTLTLAAVAGAAVGLAGRPAAAPALRFEPVAGRVAAYAARGRGFGFMISGREARVRVGDARSAADVGFRLLDASPNSEPVAEGRLPGESNYLVGKAPSLWRTHVPGYSRVRVRRAYPGVDLVCYQDRAGLLQVDFAAVPGAQPGRIGLEVTGAASVRVDEEGSLVAETAAGPVRWLRPYAYQVRAGKRLRVAAAFRQEARSNRVRFELGRYDRSLPLVVDPGLAASTYLGGTLDDGIVAISVDASGCIYALGFACSRDFPVTPGAYKTVDPAPPGDYNSSVVITKFSADGKTLVYSTYLGAGAAGALAVSPAGEACVSGGTSDGNFATTPGAYQRVFKGAYDCFVARLTPAGDGLAFATYLGGTLAEAATGLALGADGCLTLCGNSYSANYPTTAGAFQPAYPSASGSQCGFVTKLNLEGSGLVYSTYLAGTLQEDTIRAMAMGADGCPVLTGRSFSADFPTTPGAYQRAYGGAGDIFLAKVRADGSGLVYSTYLGGPHGEWGDAVALDAAGRATLTGRGDMLGFPITTGVVRPAYSEGSGAFITRFTADGTGLVWSTMIVCMGGTLGRAVAVDATGRTCIGVETYSASYPVTSNAFAAAHAGGAGTDCAVTLLSPSADRILYSTYLGGSSTDWLNALALDTPDGACVAGQTLSTNWPTTAGAFQRTPMGRSEAYLTRAQLPVATSVTGAPASAALGQAVQLTATLHRISSGAGLAGKAVTFEVGAAQSTATTDALGVAALAYTPVEAGGVGQLTYRAAFAGDAGALASEGQGTLTVGRAATSVYMPDRTGVVTTPVALKGYLKRTTDNAWVAGRTLRFTVDGATVGEAATDAAGMAALTWTIGAGPATRALGAAFAGDASYQASAGSATLTAQMVSTKLYVVDRTARVKAYVVLKAYLFLTSNALVVGKPVGITLDGSSVGSIDTNTQGCAQFGITVPEGVGAGVRTIRAEFAGDAGYRASAGQGGLTVTRGALYLWPYVRTGRAGTSHPLRAFVRSLPDYVVQPGKQVDFSVDGTAMGSGAVAADGWAASAWAIPSAQPAGSHTAAAAFAGDAWYAPATATAAFNVVR